MPKLKLNFIRLDPGLPEVAVLVTALLQAREAAEQRPWSFQQEPTTEVLVGRGRPHGTEPEAATRLLWSSRQVASSETAIGPRTLTLEAPYRSICTRSGSETSVAILPPTSMFPPTGRYESHEYQATDRGLTDQTIPYTAKRMLIATIVPAAWTSGPFGLRRITLPRGDPNTISEMSVISDVRWSSIFMTIGP